MKGAGVMATNEEVSPYDRCMVCGKKRAVFLCDFPCPIYPTFSDTVFTSK